MVHHDWFERAKQVIPGGVNSPVRAFGAVGGVPRYVVRGAGARLYGAAGEEWIDFCGSWGPLLFGHAHPAVVTAVQRAAAGGLTFGANTVREVEFAERLVALVPSLEQVRLVSSGTEAVMTALRLARGYTGRSRVVKFEGCYHGHSDSLLVSAGSGLLTGGIASSAGVATEVAALTHVVPYNDADGVEELLADEGGEVAAVVVEPLAGNMGVVQPQAEFLARLRRATERCGALLIFDEVISGFRLGPTTFGELCGIRPDLTTLGKIVGGGMPLAAVGGRREIMEHLAPLGRVYQAGTLSGNPVAVAAGVATLELIEKEPPYGRLEELGARLQSDLEAAAGAAGVALHCARAGSMFTPFFRAGEPTNLREVQQCNVAAYAAFCNGMLARGIYLPPAQFEAGFISAAHGVAEIERFGAAAAEVLPQVAALL